jgi:hypothetical protein
MEIVVTPYLFIQGLTQKEVMTGIINTIKSKAHEPEKFVHHVKTIRLYHAGQDEMLSLKIFS